LFGDAKVRHKKHPAKENFVGWELVGVAVGVEPFFASLVGVEPYFGGNWWAKKVFRVVTRCHYGLMRGAISLMATEGKSSLST
jgi:hypothetical protein